MHIATGDCHQKNNNEYKKIYPKISR
jgi:hypothetical protein